MPSLIEILAQQLGSSASQTISKQLGADEQQTRTAIAAAVPSLMEALTRTASTPEGARRLHQTVEQDHDGSLLDEVNDYIEQKDSNKQGGQGADLLKDILGPKQKQVESGVGKMSGLDAGSVAKLMAMLAPLVLGAIGRKQKQEKLDSDGLSKYLGQEREAFQKGDPKQASIFGKMLDQDGDGDFDASDMMRVGASMLGQMFKK